MSLNKDVPYTIPVYIAQYRPVVFRLPNSALCGIIFSGWANVSVIANNSGSIPLSDWFTYSNSSGALVITNTGVHDDPLLFEYYFL